MSATKQKRMWAVMKAHSWGSIEVGGHPLAFPKDGPHKFVPLFNTKRQAVRFAGSDEHVYEVSTIPNK
jgi:hypothetical protein